MYKKINNEIELKDFLNYVDYLHERGDIAKVW